MNTQRYLVLALSICSLAFCRSSFGQGGLPQPGAAPAQPAAGDPTMYRQQISYMLGQNVGNDLRENQIDVDLESLIAGLKDGLQGNPPKWSEEQLQAARQNFAQEMRAKVGNRVQQMAERNTKQGEAFLAQNKQQPGVQATPSGLQYKVLQQGTGATPTPNDTVKCHYRGTLIDGTEFDSSYSRGEPAEFPVNAVIPGWTEALQKMKVGDKWQLVVPADLAYGLNPPGPPIEPNSLLIFEVELLGINGQ
jgi:FKBP-type peptidyl-prolyl cis-trans isomerase FklB